MQEAQHRNQAEWEIALERADAVAPLRGALLIFWGLILAKCCLAQYLIFRHDIEVNGWVFIWLPSILAGLVCTGVYARDTIAHFRRTPVTSRIVRGLWAGLFGALALTAIFGIGGGGLDPLRLPAMVAVFAGAGFFAQSTLQRERAFLYAAAGWWLGATFLFFTPGINALAVLSLLIVLFQVCPCALLH